MNWRRLWSLVERTCAAHHESYRWARRWLIVAGASVLAACENRAGKTPLEADAGLVASAPSSNHSAGQPQPDSQESASTRSAAPEPRSNDADKGEDDLAALAWVEDERHRWLFVRRIRGDAAGAWATGTFDPTRNKIDIRTHDVHAFSLQTSRMPINWNRPVVLGIDGSNSELRKRDQSHLLFEVDQYGAWVVRDSKQE
jgi:hypothetical protein